VKATKYRRGFYGTARILGGDTADSASNVEQAACTGRSRACGNPTFDTPVDLRIVSHRTRLADADGISAKAAIDGLVQAGIIADDSTKEVREVSYSQIKVKNKEDEKTVIQITRVSE
jgi:hypothetical protein